MENKHLLKQAYVLHTRSYRETSLLVDLFTLTHGKITAVARGVRRPKSPLKGLLQAFVPLWISWGGRGELVTLYKIESNVLRSHLKGAQLMAGLYLNELLMRVLPAHDPYPTVFKAYFEALKALETAADLSPILRQFEFMLLKELGYGIELESTADESGPIHADFWYAFKPGQGFFKVLAHTSETPYSRFLGEDLLAMNAGHLHVPSVLQSAHRLIEIALQALLKNKMMISKTLVTNSSFGF